jgi:hypothetical protein
MFNTKQFLDKIVLIIALTSILISCDEEVQITFGEFNIERSEYAIIEINAPRAEGDYHIIDSINSRIENHIARVLNFAEDETKITLDASLKKFDSVYLAFKEDFEETSLIWEAIVDGEVTYQSPDIISIALNSYLNTGGAHGNMTISFLNFNARTGDIIKNNALIKNNPAFLELAKTHFKKKLQVSKDNESISDYFFGEDFHLPSNIGLSDEGLVLIYNVYEIASYSQGITEIIIPFEEALSFLFYN